jgi:NAD(P)-dependent dehydrogenase (short-subunit alcohol dehydrogenase family)
MANKVALITGASVGIGLATAKLFQKNGFTVINFDIQPPAEPEAITETFQVDLCNFDQIHGAFDQMLSKYNRLDVLVNNAGAVLIKPLSATSVDEFQKVLNLATTTPFLLSKLAQPHLKKSKGAIVNVSSVHAQATLPNITAYSTGKGGMVALNRGLALEFAPDIRVNAVMPGSVDTPMLRGHIGLATSKPTEEIMGNLAEEIPLKRIADPIEIARVIYFLADSENASFVTGQTLIADGGLLAKIPAH